MTEPTMVEIARRLDEVSQRLLDLANQLRTDYVRTDLYGAQREADRDAIRELRDRADKAEATAAANRRLLLTTLIGPVLVGLVMLYIAAKFGGAS